MRQNMVVIMCLQQIDRFNLNIYVVLHCVYYSCSERSKGRKKKKTVVCVIVLANRTGRHVTQHWDLQLDGMKIKYCKFNHAMH